MSEGMSWWVFLAFIGKNDQTGGSYLPRCVRRGRKRRSKASSSSSRWNVYETANFGRESVRTDVAPAEKWPSRSESARRERDESSAPRVRHGFLQPSPLTLTSFVETFAVAATRARLRNGPARIEEIPQDCTRDASEFNGTRWADEAIRFIWHRRRTIPWNSPSRLLSRLLFTGLYSVVERFYINNLQETQGNTVRSHKVTSWSASGVHTQHTHTTSKDCLRTVFRDSV